MLVHFYIIQIYLGFSCQIPYNYSSSTPTEYYCNQIPINYISLYTSETNELYVGLTSYSNVECQSKSKAQVIGFIQIQTSDSFTPSYNSPSITLNLEVSSNTTLSCPTTTDKFITYTSSSNSSQIISRYIFTDITTGGTGNVITITQTSVVSNNLYVPQTITVEYTVDDANTIVMAIGTLCNIYFGILAIAANEKQSTLEEGIIISLNVLMGIIFNYFPNPSS